MWMWGKISDRARVLTEIKSSSPCEICRWFTARTCPDAPASTFLWIKSNQIREDRSPDRRKLFLMRARMHASSGRSVVIWGHLLYTARSTGDALPALCCYWPRSGSGSCISMAPQERIFSGTAHRFGLSASAFLRHTMQLIEMGSQTFPYEETHPNTHARLDFIGGIPPPPAVWRYGLLLFGSGALGRRNLCLRSKAADSLLQLGCLMPF